MDYIYGSASEFRVILGFIYIRIKQIRSGIVPMPMPLSLEWTFHVRKGISVGLFKLCIDEFVKRKIQFNECGVYARNGITDFN